MQKPPQLLPTTLEDGQAPGIKYRIDGELVPVLTPGSTGPSRCTSSTTLCSGKIQR